jgi:hypothetical protein
VFVHPTKERALVGAPVVGDDVVLLAPPVERGITHFVKGQVERCGTGGRVGAAASWDAERGDLELVIVDASERVVATGTGVGQASINTPSLCGDFVLVIRARKGDLVPYTLHVFAPRSRH